MDDRSAASQQEGQQREQIAELAERLYCCVRGLATIAEATKAGIEQAHALLDSKVQSFPSANRALARETDRAEEYGALCRDLLSLVAFCRPGMPVKVPQCAATTDPPTAQAQAEGLAMEGLRLLIDVRTWSNRQSSPLVTDAHAIGRELEQLLRDAHDPFLLSVADSITLVLHTPRGRAREQS